MRNTVLPVAVAALGLLVGGLQPAVAAGAPVAAAETSGGGEYNPNGFDARKTMDVIRHPRADLTLVASHRGNHALIDGRYPGVPENSLQSIALAAKSGIEQIEIDVKLLKDGTPVLSHDTNLRRETCLGSAASQFDPRPGRPNSDASDPRFDFPLSFYTQSQIKSYFYLRDSVVTIQVLR